MRGHHQSQSAAQAAQNCSQESVRDPSFHETATYRGIAQLADYGELSLPNAEILHELFGLKEGDSLSIKDFIAAAARFSPKEIERGLKSSFPYFCEETATQALILSDQILKGLVEELESLKKQYSTLREHEREIERITKKLLRVSTRKSTLSEKIAPDHDIFKQDLETPHALKDRECDRIVEQILEIYGHKNESRYLSGRRNVRHSSWQLTPVPTAVKTLVSFRRTASDYNLDAEDVRPTLRKAVIAISDQLAIEQRAGLIRKALLNGEDRAGVASDILKFWEGDERLPQPLKRLKKLLSKHQSTLDPVSEYAEIRPALESIIKLFREFTTRIEDDLKLFRRQSSNQEICSDPIAFYKSSGISLDDAGARVISAFTESSAGDRAICLGALSEKIASIKWYNLFSRGFKKHLIKIRDTLRAIEDKEHSSHSIKWDFPR